MKVHQYSSVSNCGPGRLLILGKKFQPGSLIRYTPLIKFPQICPNFRILYSKKQEKDGYQIQDAYYFQEVFQPGCLLDPTGNQILKSRLRNIHSGILTSVLSAFSRKVLTYTIDFKKYVDFYILGRVLWSSEFDQMPSDI